MKRLILLRPEPGASESAKRALALGIDAVKLPLFAVEPVHWRPPDPSNFDALLLTSANTVRHGGPGLVSLGGLPVYAVGTATAEAARAAGLSVARVGGAGVDALLAGLPEDVRLLHLGGEDRIAPQSHGAHITPSIVYRSVKIERTAKELEVMKGCVVAVHSRRAGDLLATLIADRLDTIVACLSSDAAAGLGQGWQSVAIAARPSDAALLALAAELCLLHDQ